MMTHYLFGTKLPFHRAGIFFRPEIGHNLDSEMGTTKRAGKKTGKQMYVVRYNRGEWEKSCISLAVGTYEGADMKKGRLVTLKRHRDTKFKSEHPASSTFALPEGLKFRDGHCVRESNDLKRPPGETWTDTSINTHVWVKPTTRFEQAEVAFDKGSDEWQLLDMRFHSM